MQDSDDLYFGNDDFVVDDATIAALDAAEQTYATTQAQVVREKRRSGSPPPKRVKLTHEYRTKQQNGNLNTFEDIPDVSLQGDGSYSVFPDKLTLGGRQSVNIVNVDQQSTSRVPAPRKPVSHPVRPSQTPGQPIAGPSRHRHETMPRQTSGPVFGSQYTTKPVPPMPRPAAPVRPVAASQSRTQHAEPGGISKSELDRLKRQIQILSSQLTDSDTRLKTKEGEVAVLREQMKKTTEDHLSELDKLARQKEEAEKAKAQLQKEQKEELERLKTAYSFKQHELESSMRRPPWSVKKTVKYTNMTPMKVPAEMREWSSGARGEGPAGISETPRISRVRDMETPSRPPRQSQRLEKVITRELPGFVNSFIQTSPTRLFSQRTKKDKDKGKGKARDDDIFVAPPSPPSSPTRYGMRISEVPDLPMDNSAPPPPVPEEPQQPTMFSSPPETGQEEDVKMAVEPPPESAVVQDDFSDVEPPHWRDTMHRLLFAHTLAPSKTPTLQLLLNSPLPQAAPADDLQAYSSACARLLESVAAGSSLIEWNEHLRTVLRILSGLGVLLTAHSAIIPLTALFNLLRSASYTIPSFTEALLSPVQGETEDSPAEIALAMRNAIQRYAPTSQEEATRNESAAALTYETVALLEALSWNIPEVVVPRLAAVVRAPRVLSTLLGPQQPWALVRDATRAITVLGTHPNFFRQLLAQPYPEAGQEPAPVEESPTIHHLDQLYSYLADSSRKVDLKEAILSFISTMALAHSDALTILLQSYILIPSIVSYLTDILNPLWEDDLDLVASPSQTDWVIQMTNRLVALLSYLVFSSPTAFNLRYRLHHLPIKRFNGIAHMFTVTMSRLSFADSPTWLTEVQKVQLEQTMDTATKLLEQVVDGPELEIAWSAFQVDNESKPETEEEREARLLHPDDTE